MPINLDAPLAWKAANTDEREMLDDLQGNILKGHGRNFSWNLFLKFDPHRHDDAREFVHGIAAELTSAHAQLDGTRRFQQTGEDAGVFMAFFLSARGYGALARADLKPTADAQPFEAGMKSRIGALNDPPLQAWNQTFQADVHAMLLIADDNEAARDEQRADIIDRIGETNGAVVLLGEEEGRALRNADGHGIEHFGYVDGRSQPLMLVEDWQEEREKLGGVDRWDPQITLGQVLVRCPGGATSNSHGSYFVFRKLEQNVRGFKMDEQQLAAFLELDQGEGDPEKAAELREVAGAFVVGRFENGQPVVETDDAGSLRGKSVPNNFNFAADPDGLKCPFAGHIRKTNPRGESETKLGAPPGSEKRHLMARRGITYGRRGVHPNDPRQRLEDMPTGDVGLLFMAYQSSLGNQFEFTQLAWVNNADFVASGIGIDPIIGQTPGANEQHWPQRWGQALKAQGYDFSDWVTMQGGEYFFAPSLSTLRTM